MLHDVLLSLWSGPTNFCTIDTNEISGEKWFAMIEMKDFLHPSERKLLEQIMDIALDYYQIQQFITNVLTKRTSNGTSQKENSTLEQTDSEAEELKEGLYIKEFCNGLDSVLEEYRNEIVELEKIILEDKTITLTYILSRINKYVTFFTHIKTMIATIKTEKTHGCLLIGRLHKYYNNTITSVRNAVTQITSSVNAIFYRQLCNWIIFGDLVDIYDEFFISDAQCSDEDFLSSVLANELSTSSSDNLRGYQMRRPPKVRKFLMKENMVPSNITLVQAQTILFMGRMVWIIRNDPMTTNNSKFSLRPKRDIWGGKEAYYFQKLQNLQNYPFHSIKFEEAIEECRVCLTKYLWMVMVEEAKLFDHLRLLRDYYALGRGELFQQFIVAARDALKDTRADYLTLKLNTIFKETAKKMYADSDKTYKRFEIILPKDPNKPASTNPWLHTEMNFEIVWPLHIIFHPGTMALYNKVFNFLLRVKKTQIDLHKLWAAHMEGKLQIPHHIWTLRNTLMFLINNLQYYLQVDVIEVEFAVLIKAVTNAKNVEDIIRLHSVFLGNLISRTFLMVVKDTKNDQDKHQLYKLPPLNYEIPNPVHTTLLHFLKLCDRFCMEAATWGPELTAIEQQEIAKLQDECDFLVEHLLGMLYSLREHTSGNHLLQLLHQIDFNRWFSKNTPDFNLSIL